MKTHFPLLTAAILFACFLFVQSARAQVTVAGAHASSNGSYATLYAAFTAINGQTQTGKTITVSITANITEVTNFPSLSAGTWTSLTILPSGGAWTISGTTTGAFLTLNGADGVVFNGLNASGNSLTIENQNTGTSASTILFQTAANTNTITNCTIKGSTAANTNYAVVTFRGGLNNNITYTNIGPSGSNKPWACIVSSSSTNTGELIDHCNLYDFYAASAYQAGIYLNMGTVNSTWTISNNSFYQTASVSATAGTVDGIYMGSGNGYIISNNYFGGSSSSCGGSAMTYTGSLYSMNFLETPSLGVNSSIANTITYNTISNINVTSTNATAPSGLWDQRFSAFFIKSGKHIIKYNTIGSMTGVDNIVLDNGSNSSPYRILQLNGASSSYSTTGSIIQAFSNNNIGGIKINSTNADFKFIKSELNNSGDICQLDSVCNNNFGSGIANNISIPGANTALFYLIYIQTTSNVAPTVISGNTIQNITRGGTGGLYAIFSMVMCSVSNNTIQNISTAATTDGVRGIYLTYNSSGYTIANNFINNLTSSSTVAPISGIYTDNSGTNSIFNNVITIGYNDAINNLKYGIYLRNGSNVYFNTVYIGGNGSSGSSSSYAIFRFTNSGTLNIRNNIFNNARSNTTGGTGTHYAISLAGTSVLTIDYNDYFISGSGGMLGYLSSNKSTIALWQTATGGDAHSLNAIPSFASAGGSTALSYLPSAALAGVSGTGITTDYAGSTRAATPTMGAYEGSFAVTWDGSTDSDWNTGANWSTDAVPNASANVTIPVVPNDPIVNQAPGTPATCNNLTINSGAVLTIAAGKALTVNGTLTNSASGNTGLIINNGGSLIESTAGIAGTVNSAIPASEWHMISAPISDATSNLFLGHYLQTLNESTTTYTDITLTNNVLTPVKGYAAYGDVGGFTAAYAGTLNTGNQTYSTTAASYSSPNGGWNLVGNPYPCSIDWNAASGWTKTNVNNAIYVHRNSALWATFIAGVGANSGTQYIAPGQGFLVQSTAAGTLAMTNAVKVHNATTFFKNADEVVPNLLRIEVSGNGYKDEAVVRFAADATAEFDGNYDAHKLYGDVAEAAQVYTLGSIPLAINSLPATSTVPLGIYTGAAGTYTLAATEINDLTGVTLEDTNTGIFTDLTKSPCSVELTAGESGQRFVLHFGPLSIEDKESTPASIYSYRHTAYISMNGNTTGDIFIYTISGQLVATLTSASGMNEVQLPVSGTYIVKVVGDKTMGVKKVFIN